MQGGKPSGLNSDFGESFVEQARSLPGVERVSEGVADVVEVVRENGAAEAVLIQGWKLDNFGFESVRILSGRTLRSGDVRKVLCGRTLAANLNKKAGDTLAFGGDTENRYEIVGIFKSSVVFEEGGLVLPLADAQRLTAKRITGFSVRVKKMSPDSAAEIETVRQQIEALRDPNDPATRLCATGVEL